MTNAREPQSRANPAEQGDEVREAAVEAVTESTSGEIQEGVGHGGALSRVAAEAARHALEEAREQGVTPEEAAAGVARGAIAAALGYDPAVAEAAISSGIRGALETAREGGEDLARVAHGSMRAGLEAAVQAGLDCNFMAESLARVIVQTTADAPEILELVAQQTVAGAVDAARDLGLTPEGAAVSAATGAIEAAGAYGPGAFNRVRGILTAPINGVEVVLRQPTRHDAESLRHEGIGPTSQS